MPRTGHAIMIHWLRDVATAHGDFHYAKPVLHRISAYSIGRLGTATRCYDAAMLHSHSLLGRSGRACPTRVGYILDTPDGHFAELAVISELLHAAARRQPDTGTAPSPTRRPPLGRRLPTFTKIR